MTIKVGWNHGVGISFALTPSLYSGAPYLGSRWCLNGMETILHSLGPFPSIWWNWVGWETTLWLRCQGLPWRKANSRRLTFPKQRPIQVNLEPTDLEGKRATWQVRLASWSSQTTHWERSFLEARLPLTLFRIPRTVYLVPFTWTLSYGHSCAAAPSKRCAGRTPVTGLGKQEPVSNTCYYF